MTSDQRLWVISETRELEALQDYETIKINMPLCQCKFKYFMLNAEEMETFDPFKIRPFQVTKQKHLIFQAFKFLLASNLRCLHWHIAVKSGWGSPTIDPFFRMLQLHRSLVELLCLSALRLYITTNSGHYQQLTAINQQTSLLANVKNLQQKNI